MSFMTLVDADYGMGYTVWPMALPVCKCCTCMRAIRERTKQPTASSILRQRRLRWFGHLHRMPSSLPVRRVFDFNPNIHGWKRSRGRPKTRWADSIKHDLHSAGLNTISESIITARWRFIGHVLRLPRDAPAQRAIDHYFADTEAATFRGRPRTSLPTILCSDLRRSGRTLRQPADIEALRALSREQWRQMERDISA